MASGARMNWKKVKEAANTVTLQSVPILSIMELIQKKEVAGKEETVTNYISSTAIMKKILVSVRNI